VRRPAGFYELLLLLPPLMPLPPKPPELPELLELLAPPPMPLLPLLAPDEPEDPDELPALPRLPADTDPALRLAVLDEPAGADEMLLPADDALTDPATAADLLVAALTREVASAADLLLAATPPPVPEDCPDTAELAAARVVLCEAAWDDAIVDGLDPLGVGGGE
jgi:hypothetical protein